jgi:hypothetical protein
LYSYNSPPQSAILMSPSSALLPQDTPNVKFRMELASQIQDSPSSLAHLDANLMLNIGDTPNDKIRYAYRFGDDFGYGYHFCCLAHLQPHVLLPCFLQSNQSRHRICVFSSTIHQGHASSFCLRECGQSPFSRRIPDFRGGCSIQCCQPQQRYECRRLRACCYFWTFEKLSWRWHSSI